MKLPSLDSNATLGLLPEVEAMLSCKGLCYGNPSSVHQDGQHARAAVEEAREVIKVSLGMNSSDIIAFNSGATESDNTALFMPVWDYLEGRTTRNGKENVVISAIEHPAITVTAERLGKMGFAVRKVFPRSDGSFHADDVLAQCDADTLLVSVMLVNNESGQILPVRDIFAAVKSKFPFLLTHTDAVQAFGKIPIRFHELNADLISLSGHKIGALQGVGALGVKAGIEIAPSILGGAQETRRRAGTENVAGIVSFGFATSLAIKNLPERYESALLNTQSLKQAISEIAPFARWNFEGLERVPSTLSLTIKDIDSRDLLVALDLEGIRVSSGSACSSGKTLPSPTLIAYGFSEADALSTIRISPSFRGKVEEYEAAGMILGNCLNRFCS